VRSLPLVSSDTAGVLDVPAFHKSGTERFRSDRNARFAALRRTVVVRRCLREFAGHGIGDLLGHRVANGSER